jgi:hypothetical protein
VNEQPELCAQGFEYLVQGRVANLQPDRIELALHAHLGMGRAQERVGERYEQVNEHQPKLAIETGLMALDGRVEMFA